MSARPNSNLTRALRVIDNALQGAETGPWTRIGEDKAITRLPDFSEEAAIEYAERAKKTLARIETVDVSSLPQDVANTLEIVRYTASIQQHAGEWYWLVFDPGRIGFYAMFAPTAYGGGFVLSGLHKIFDGFEFSDAGDVYRFHGLIADYARIVRQFNERTRGQAQRGIYMPNVQLDQAIALMEGMKSAAVSVLAVNPERLSNCGGQAVADAFARQVREQVQIAFDDLLASLSDPEYRRNAPNNVGLSQYPGGREIYDALVRMHLTVDMSSEEVHAAGHARMRRIHEQIQELFDEINFSGDAKAYLTKIESDPVWRRDDDAAISALFRSYIDRLKPHIESNFDFKPEAPYDVKPLPTALAGSMSFGFYQPPSMQEPSGYYFYNGLNLARNALPNIAALNYHELVPGHHFHLASQYENKDLHPLAQAAFVNAFNEGWAEYAANFAGEIGMYQSAEERFGRLMMDAFLTCRLVVDTGMNALGWSLEQAQDYMRFNGFVPETEVRTESIRYSCDIPAQSLAYKLGDTYLIELRDQMKVKLGEKFDIRHFHDAVLRPGALPLPIVKQNVELKTETLLTESEC